ncbi:hypothetical protein STEG23_037069 [Scotinomys teguina]
MLSHSQVVSLWGLVTQSGGQMTAEKIQPDSALHVNGRKGFADPAVRMALAEDSVQGHSLIHNRPHPQQASSTTGLIHNRPPSSTTGLIHNRPPSSTTGLIHNRPHPQQASSTTGLPHPQQASSTTGLIHNRPHPQQASSTTGLIHNRPHPQQAWLGEDPGSIPSTYMAVHYSATHYRSQPSSSRYCTQVVHIHTEQTEKRDPLRSGYCYPCIFHLPPVHLASKMFQVSSPDLCEKPVTDELPV